MNWSKMRVVATAVVALVGASAAGYVGQDAQSSAGDGLLVRAEFTDASPILVGNDVKVDGVAVGEVVATEAADRTALVTMYLDPSALPVYRDARFTIRPVSLLGERFVDLERGTPAAAALATGDTVPLSATTTNTDLDQVLNSLDDPTGEGLAMMVTTLGEGLDGNGTNADATIRALTPALTDTERFAAVLREQNVLLNDLVDRFEPLAGALAVEDGRTLDELVATADQLLGATAEQQRQLEATLAELPATLASARTTLDRVAGTAEETTPTLAALRPATDDLRAISAELYGFADALDPALSSAEPVLERGRELVAEAAPVVAALGRAGPDLRTTADGLAGVVDELATNLDDVYNFVRFWAMTANGQDGLSNYFRGFVVVNPQSMTGLLPQGFQDVPLPGATEDSAADAPALPAPPELPAPGGLLAPPDPDTDQTDPGSGPTGLDEQQERGMVDFLLGGSR